jgi:hypothetical protein
MDRFRRDVAAVLENGDDMTPAQFLALLKDPKVAAELKTLAGAGVHDQKLGRSGETIAQDIQGDDVVLAREFGEVKTSIQELRTFIETALAGKPQA